MPIYVKEHFHIAQGTAGYLTTTCMNLASLMGVLIGGAWADRWTRTCARARIFVPSIGLCLAAPGLLLAANTGLLPFAVAGVVVFGMARAFVDPNLMPILCLVADPRYRATGYGVLEFVCLHRRGCGRLCRAAPCGTGGSTSASPSACRR